MVAEGATILDIGGESTRPGAPPVAPADEQERVLPLIRALRGAGAVMSIDTRHASTMRAALDAGASLVNDVTGLAHDPDAASVVAQSGCRVVLMHMRGTPQTMATLTQYDDVVAEVVRAIADRICFAEQAGVARGHIIIDPGIGFAKTGLQSLALLRRLNEFEVFNLPILVGASRKSFIGTYGGEPDPQRRMPGSIAAALFALERGASILRVHDVAQTVQAVRMWTALRDGPGSPA
jgi:dihydropteroate synthase